jgi:hypothetical protein
MRGEDSEQDRSKDDADTGECQAAGLGFGRLHFAHDLDKVHTIPSAGDSALTKMNRRDRRGTKPGNSSAVTIAIDTAIVTRTLA